MGGTNKKLTTAAETYLDDLRRVRATGGATGERSSYGPLANLLNAVGATLKPKVFCVGELADQGAGHPDFGLYTAKQVQRGRPREGQAPERGVVEVKSPHEDLRAPAVREQVVRYWGRYRLVLVTNLREFDLVGPDADGGEAMLESFRLAESEEAFARRLEHPRALARAVGAGLGEYLSRALSHRAALAEPKDLAWLLASYARDGLARVEAAGDAPSLKAVRSALEDALGVRFEGERGARFFRSTLVQTLFYGVFSAWVLWARAGAGSSAAGGMPRPAGGVGHDTARFSWREAVWHLRAPVLRALFQQLSDPGRLQPLGLVEVLDWTAAALDRVDREAFFSRFNEGEAVPYFYEPFLEAFDPELRKQLGVWYTPAEVVRYMVARVDRALKDDLDIPDGLAAENVYVLDPCCGTGAYLAEVLRRIAANLGGRGLGALAGARVRQAATERVFGFEIMPAPFVVAHLQVGLTMQDLDAPLADDGAERAGIFLTKSMVAGNNPAGALRRVRRGPSAGYLGHVRRRSIRATAGFRRRPAVASQRRGQLVYSPRSMPTPLSFLSPARSRSFDAGSGTSRFHEVGPTSGRCPCDHECVDTGRVRTAALYRRSLESVIESYPLEFDRRRGALSGDVRAGGNVVVQYLQNCRQCSRRQARSRRRSSKDRMSRRPSAISNT